MAVVLKRPVPITAVIDELALVHKCELQLFSRYAGHTDRVSIRVSQGNCSLETDRFTTSQKRGVGSGGFLREMRGKSPAARCIACLAHGLRSIGKRRCSKQRCSSVALAPAWSTRATPSRSSTRECGRREALRLQRARRAAERARARRAKPCARATGDAAAMRALQVRGKWRGNVGGWRCMCE